jgi:hypothetical protein
MSLPDDSKLDFENLKLLFEYTKFHILLYTSLITLLIGLFLFGFGGNSAAQFRFPMKLVVACFVVAGGAGGVIGSSIPSYKSLSTFLDKYISPFDIPYLKLTGQQWVNLEHSAFWVGIIVATVVFIAN